MRFELEPHVLNDDLSTLRDLDLMLGRVADQVHAISILDGDAMECSAWFAGLRSDLKELVRGTVFATAFSSTGRVLRVGSELSLDAAVRIAYQPLLVVVENKANDGILVEIALRSYGNAETIRLWAANPKTGKAIELVHGGGTGDLRKELDRLIDEARRFGVPVRAVAMTDSDARWPGEARPAAVAIATLCGQDGVPCVVLSCRSAENYLPDSVFQRWADEPENVNARPQVAALLRLSSEQRDHFPMKGKKAAAKGFLAIEVAGAPLELQALFASVPLEDRRVLVGFHGHIIELFRVHLPASGAVELDLRDHRHDLRKLVSIIEAEL